MKPNKFYELPLVKNYVSSWTFTDAIRELLQNSLDSDSPFDVEFDRNVLTISSVCSSLPVSSLLLGATTKADDDSKIGNFGEGYKLAMLVLLRQGYEVQLYNDGVLWIPSFKVSSIYGVETLHIEEITKGSYNFPNGVQFLICGVTGDDYQLIKDSCLRLQTKEEIGEVINTTYGTILLESKSKVYVNGLYVCDTQNRFSYDFRPEYIKLDRDRNSVDAWKMSETIMQMWNETTRTDLIVDMLENNARDIYYADVNASEHVKEAVYQYFIENHPGHLAVCSNEQRESYERAGQVNIVHLNIIHYTVLSNHSEYRKLLTFPMIPKKTPKEILEDWFDKNDAGNYEHSDMEELINLSSTWK